MGGLKESDQWFLKPGRVEMTGRFGANFGPDRPKAIQMSANTELGIGITRWISGLGGYGYNRVGSVSLGSLSIAKADFEEVMGGVRVAAPRRFSPYGVGTAGVVWAKLGTGLFGGNLAGSEAKAAFAGGGGFNFGINKNVGAVVDFRFVKPIEFNWYARTTAGIYIRFQ